MPPIIKTFSLRTYSWSGWSADHKKVTGELLAPSIALARMELAQQGVTITFIRKKLIRLKLKSSRINKKDITIFFRQLATLINAGISLVQGLETLLHNQQHANLQNLIHSLKNDIESGKTLAQAFNAKPAVFDQMTCQLTHIAEQTGTLDTLLTRMATHQEKTLALQTQLKQALVYPGFVFIMAIVISSAMLLFVVPRFVEIFANFQAPLPALTRHVIQFSTFLINDYWIGVLPLLGFSGLQHFYKTSLRLKKLIDRMLLNIPCLSTLYKKVIFIRIARTLGTMLGAGLPITKALNLLTTISSNHSIQTALLQLNQEINAGKRIHQALQATALFPPLMIRMIKIGEESGSLTAMLEKTVELFEADIAWWINNLSHLLEPLIIMILGVLIGGLVIAMYLPIFKLGTVI
jgi:type IV pilus assembly protein PilC